VTAPRATEADALSTALAVMPPDRGRRLLQAACVRAVLIGLDGRATIV